MKRIPLFKGVPNLEELAKAVSNKNPLFLGIPLAASNNYRICQLDCGCCCIEKYEKGKRLKIRDHFRIIDEFAELGGKYIKTATVGEPFLDRKFFNPKGELITSNVLQSRFPLIDYANSKGIYWTSFSNMVSLTEKITQELYKKDFSIIGKLNSMNPDVLEETTGNKGYFAKENWATYKSWNIPRYLKYLIDAGFNNLYEGKYTRLGVDIVITKNNFRDIPEVVDFCIENNIYPDIETLEISGDAKKNQHLLVLSNEENKWLYNELISVVGEKFLQTERNCTSNFCPIFTAGIVYDIDGSVRFCYNVKSTIEFNLSTHKLGELYTKMLDIKKDFKSKVEATYEYKEGILNSCPLGVLQK